MNPKLPKLALKTYINTLVATLDHHVTGNVLDISLSNYNYDLSSIYKGDQRELIIKLYYGEIEIKFKPHYDYEINSTQLRRQPQAVQTRMFDTISILLITSICDLIDNYIVGRNEHKR